MRIMIMVDEIATRKATKVLYHAKDTSFCVQNTQVLRAVLCTISTRFLLNLTTIASHETSAHMATLCVSNPVMRETTKSD
jgi:hypothetical protein